MRAMSVGLPPAAHTTSMTLSSARSNWPTKSPEAMWPSRVQPTCPATKTSSPVPLIPWLYPRGRARDSGLTTVRVMGVLSVSDDGAAVHAQRLAVDAGRGLGAQEQDGGRT